MTTEPSLAVVVPATDDPPTLSRCLEALRSSHDQPDEIIVVDSPRSMSAAAARNHGVEQTTTELVLFVDADVEIHADALGRIRAAFAADHELTALHGSYDDTPAARGTVSVFRNLLHYHVHQSNAGPIETFWTGLGAVRRRDFVTVGGFDEDRYPHPSIEDIELGKRLHAAGGKLVLDPTIQGTHLKRWTLRSMVWTDLARRGIPWMHLQLEQRHLTNSLNLGWRHRLSALSLLVAAVAAVAGALVVSAGAVLVVAALNLSLYRLLLRRQGVLRGVGGVALHGLHHLVSITAASVAVLAWVAPQPRGAKRSIVADAGEAVDSAGRMDTEPAVTR